MHKEKLNANFENLTKLVNLEYGTDMSAEDIARKSIKVASDICVFTNNNVTVEKV